MTHDDLTFRIKRKNPIKAFRLEWQISQEVLALQLGVSQATLSRMERDISPITEEVRNKIESLKIKLGG